MDLLSLLSEKKIIDSDLVEQVEEHAVKKQISYEQALIQKGVDADRILDTLSDYFSLPKTTISEANEINPDVLKYIPEESARHYKILPIYQVSILIYFVMFIILLLVNNHKHNLLKISS